LNPKSTHERYLPQFTEHPIAGFIVEHGSVAARETAGPFRRSKTWHLSDRTNNAHSEFRKPMILD
jgi:hypothetical protein